jgi:hypothetical protein
MQPASSLPSSSPLCATHGRTATGTCQRCGSFFCEACTVAGGTCPSCAARQAAGEPMYFGSSATRFALLSLVTFGMFPTVWMWRNWRLERQRGEDLSPFWRTVFAIFYVHDLMSRMNHHARSAEVEGVSAGGRTAVYVLLMLTAWIPGVGTLTALLSFLPLVGVQKLANTLNARYTPGAPARTPLTPGNILFMVLPLAVGILAAFVGVAMAVSNGAQE